MAVHGEPVRADVSGIPDTWPHTAAIVRAAGFAPEPEREEVLYAGRIDHLEPPSAPPIEGLELARRMCDFAPRFAAEVSGESIGFFDVGCDVTGAVCSPRWRAGPTPGTCGSPSGTGRRGVGSWLVRSAPPYLRLAGCDRMLVTVAVDDERAGAGRFYERLGMVRLARLERAWSTAGESGPEVISSAPWGGPMTSARPP